MQHIPVLYDTILDLLNPKEGEVVLDMTLGLGGHAKGFLEKIGPKGKLIGLDADEGNLEEASKALLDRASPERSEWRGLSMPGKAGHSRRAENVQLIHANFRDLQNLPHLLNLHTPSFDILFADLGLSSPHLDDPKRGFSFRFEGPLDCRFDQSKGETASELLMRADHEEIFQILSEYGEVRGARKLVEAILRSREEHPIATTKDLVKIVESVFGWKAKGMLPQIFQALRIAVNDELHALKVLLEVGPTLLKVHGRMGIISFHSLEDRLVKQAFLSLTTPDLHPLTGAPVSEPPFLLLTKKAIQANLKETTDNPRARSAKFRAIVKNH